MKKAWLLVFALSFCMHAQASLFNGFLARVKPSEKGAFKMVGDADLGPSVAEHLGQLTKIGQTVVASLLKKISDIFKNK